MRKTKITKLLVALLLIGFVTAVKANCTYVNINSNTNPLAICTGTVTITGVFSISGNYDISSYTGITNIVIDGGSIDFMGKYTLTLPPASKLSFINGGAITGECNNNVEIVIGSLITHCVGGAIGQGGITFDAIVTAGNLDATGTLPITLTRFDATQVANTVVLKWETASEQENAYMEVQRSRDGIHFIALHQEKGHGTTTEVQRYDWVDTRPLSGFNYYRLKQVDYEGKWEYHPIKVVDFKGKGVEGGIYLYPTEVRSRLTVALDTPTSEDASLLVVDALGRVVQRQRLGIGTIQEDMQLQDLPAGYYFMTLQSEQGLQTARFLKMKE